MDEYEYRERKRRVDSKNKKWLTVRRLSRIGAMVGIVIFFFLDSITGSLLTVLSLLMMFVSAMIIQGNLDEEVIIEEDSMLDSLIDKLEEQKKELDLKEKELNELIEEKEKTERRF
ncbi:MAG: hypothetical protein Q4P17_03915 [Methanobacterium sp.]|nr:hypothetical protein [Methanobacterium sp.]